MDNYSDKRFLSFTNVVFILHTSISTVTYLELKQTHFGCVLNGLESRCDLLNINRDPRFTTALNQIWRIVTHLIKFCFILSQTEDQTLKKKKKKLRHTKTILTINMTYLYHTTFTHKWARLASSIYWGICILYQYFSIHHSIKHKYYSLKNRHLATIHFIIKKIVIHFNISYTSINEVSAYCNSL